MAPSTSLHCSVFFFSSFDLLGLISDTHINFQNHGMGSIITKNQKIFIDYTKVKQWETFYGRHTALTPAVVEINTFLRG